MERRLGLTTKRRSHSTNIYAPFCPDCGQVIENRKALQTHFAMAHGKRPVHYKRRAGPAGSRDVSRPLNIESCDLKEKTLGEYLSDMKRIWRLSGVGRSDLVLVERVARKAQKEKALYSICFVIVQCGFDKAMATAAKRDRRVTEYVRHYADVVRRIQEQRRYARLKTSEAKAKLLCLGLANPFVCLTYAERAKAKRRDFKKRERAIYYAS